MSLGKTLGHWEDRGQTLGTQGTPGDWEENRVMTLGGDWEGTGRTLGGDWKGTGRALGGLGALGEP